MQNAKEHVLVICEMRHTLGDIYVLGLYHAIVPYCLVLLCTGTYCTYHLVLWLCTVYQIENPNLLGP